MTSIHYNVASYANQLRTSLEIAGCTSEMAATLAKAFGELIDHQAYSDEELRREIRNREQQLRYDLERRESEAKSHAYAIRAAKDDATGNAFLVVVSVLVVALVSGVLIALFRGAPA